MNDYKMLIMGVAISIVGFILYKNPIKSNERKAIECIDKNIPVCDCLKKYNIQDTVRCK